MMPVALAGLPDRRMPGSAGAGAAPRKRFGIFFQIGIQFFMLVHSVN
jgi:hypothetical protein